MFAIIGIVVLLAMVFGGFIFTGGDIGPVLHALPHEMLIIGGAAVGVGACAVLGYNQTRLDALLGVDGREEFALYVMPVGRPAGDTP